MAATSQNREKFYDYDGFVEKFKPKKTTDDCITPADIYDVVADWVTETYGVARSDMVRPFWPDADYQSYNYPAGCVVVDNPPFSILAKIKKWYRENNIKYFLFGPLLTLFGGFDASECYICADCEIVYENGANVRTGFVTNLDDAYVLRTEPALMDAVNKVNKENLKKQNRPKYIYPPEILTSSRAGYLSTHHTDYRIRRGECMRISSLDEQKTMNKGIFGGGLLLSEHAAAEHAVAEHAVAERAAAYVFKLSDREREIQKQL